MEWNGKEAEDIPLFLSLAFFFFWFLRAGRDSVFSTLFVSLVGGEREGDGGDMNGEKNLPYGWFYLSEGGDFGGGEGV